METSVAESLAEARRARRQRKLDQIEIPAEHVTVSDELLGKGGFGAVYIADFNGRNAAVKVIQVAQRSPQATGSETLSPQVSHKVLVEMRYATSFHIVPLRNLVPPRPLFLKGSANGRPRARDWCRRGLQPTEAAAAAAAQGFLARAQRDDTSEEPAHRQCLRGHHVSQGGVLLLFLVASFA